MPFIKDNLEIIMIDVVKKVPMGNVITLPLIIKKKEYYLLVQIKPNDNCFKIYVSIITDEQDGKIYSRFIFDSDGQTVIWVNKTSTLPESLIHQIIITLEKYLHRFRGSAN